MALNVEGHGDCHSHESLQSEDPNGLQNNSQDSHGIEDGEKSYTKKIKWIKTKS